MIEAQSRLARELRDQTYLRSHEIALIVSTCQSVDDVEAWLERDATEINELLEEMQDELPASFRLLADLEVA